MKILIAGDFCPQYRVASLFESKDFVTVLGEVKPILEKSDYSIVNFECPVTKGGESPIEKCGPNLQCSEKGIEAVKWAGFDSVTLANNHFLDYGAEGVENTLRACKKHDVDTVGGGMNLQEASKILYKEIGGKTLAIINCCEHEFSIATDTSAGSNPLNAIQQYYAIQEARKNADYVLVIVHGGHEHFQLPSPRMQETYRFFIDAGADAVVNHHQHCYSGYEVYKGKPIFYGLGNFCFDEKNNYSGIWNEGFLLELSFADEVTYKMYPYYQCNQKASVCIMKDNDYAAFEKRVENFNLTISDRVKLRREHEKWMGKFQKSYELLFQPYCGRILKGLYVRNILPSFMNNKKKLQILNYLICEAHLDRFKYVVYHM